MSEYDNDLTVNEAEYRGLLLCFELLETQDRMRDEINCKAPGLQLLRKKALDRLRSWPDHKFLHVKREWNQSVDKLASAALQRLEDEIVTSEEGREDLATLNRLSELLKPKPSDDVARVEAVTRSMDSRARSPRVLEEAIVQRMRSERIREAQNEEKWIAKKNVKSYLKGDLGNLTTDDAKTCSKIADDYEVDASDLLFFCPKTIKDGEDRKRIMRLVVPENLQQDFLHHYHSILVGGHQGIGRTYLRIRSHFHWRVLYRGGQRYVGGCTDCENGKGRPFAQGESPGHIQATYPFQVISMDHIPSLPQSFKENTELLIWADLCSGYRDRPVKHKRSRKTMKNVLFVVLEPAKLSGMIANPGLWPMWRSG
ncbi:Reverse transcriptase [Phytophthora palmivora]|uniref:Reverse transcriptase n=1 Tax=Phytophthora palmivora TaxID=4796 RepID=A0A2P4WXL3_9STRA|nr:Reverse transcriptase [Phytophthora palmivora]